MPAPLDHDPEKACRTERRYRFAEEDQAQTTTWSKSSLSRSRFKRQVEYRGDMYGVRSQLNDVRMSSVSHKRLACNHLLP
jgi:hypothetical protein